MAFEVGEIIPFEKTYNVRLLGRRARPYSVLVKVTYSVMPGGAVMRFACGTRELEELVPDPGERKAIYAAVVAFDA